MTGDINNILLTGSDITVISYRDGRVDPLKMYALCEEGFSPVGVVVW